MFKKIKKFFEQDKSFTETASSSINLYNKDNKEQLYNKEQFESSIENGEIVVPEEEEKEIQFKEMVKISKFINTETKTNQINNPELEKAKLLNDINIIELQVKQILFLNYSI